MTLWGRLGAVPFFIAPCFCSISQIITTSPSYLSITHFGYFQVAITLVYRHQGRARALIDAG